MTEVDLDACYDVLIAGGGNAALCTAISALRAGASVLIVEAAPEFYRGGNTRHTRNIRFAHDAANGIVTGPYPEDEYFDDILRVTKGKSDRDLTRFAVAHTRSLWDYYQSAGVRFQQPLAGTLGLGRTNAFFLGGGRAMLNSLYRTAERLGANIAYDAEVVDLDLSGLTFQRAKVKVGPNVRHVKARNLVAASGGYEANIEWLKENWGDAAENFQIRGTRYNRGSLLRALLDRGAEAVGDPSQWHAVAVDSRAPRFDGGIVTRLDCVVFGIVVDKDANRFYDEGEDIWPKRYAIWGRLIAERPGQQAFGIFDSKVIKRFMPSLFPPIAADTIDDLAAKIGLNREALQRTVQGFNAAVRPGTLDPATLDDCKTEGVFPAKSHWATRIDTPPYFAYPLSPGITFTYLGVKVDRTARVQFGGGASPNVFATGEIIAGNVLGEGYVGGLGLALGCVFGRIAGEEAATNVHR